MTPRCIAIAPVGAAWMDAALPVARRELLDIDVVVPPSTTIDGRGVRGLTTVTLDRSAHTPFVEEPD
jgi:hypothetical protein